MAWLEYVQRTKAAQEKVRMERKEADEEGDSKGDKGRAEGGIVQGIVHAMKCLVVYIRLEIRVLQRRQEEEAKRLERKRRARWLLCAAIVREYKERKQRAILEERARQRDGRVCSRTRNVGRITPMKGVVYDETTRRGTRLPAHLMCTRKNNRWPLRDKCGPTLVRTLFHVWNIDTI